MKHNYIDLFCGAGGLSLGFELAGYKNLFSLDSNPAFAKTYRYNFPEHKLLLEDIKNVTNDRICELTGGADVDIIIGGPPCQGFSLAGNIARNFLEDDRNSLFSEFVRFVSVVNPKMFIMENVAAMATHSKGKTIKLITSAFENAGVGYKVQWEILNSADYGIAQERRRIVIVGIRADINATFVFPEKTGEKRTVKDAIDDLPPLSSGEESSVPNHNAMTHSKQMLEKMSYVKDGGTRLDIPEELRPASGDARKYIRYNSQKPSVCVTGDMRKIFHYSQNRALTCRELARLQSFPDSFIFKGNSIQIQQQIGNAVPPKLAEKIALQAEVTLTNAKISKSKLHREQGEAG